jgi:hypothetical protein
VSAPPTDEELQAKTRYGVLHLVRLGGLGMVLLGIAIANAVVPAPVWLGWISAVGGLAGFFFAPPLLVRRWKAGDRGKR